MSHVVPTKESEPARVRTGYEKVIAHRTRMPFAYSAVEDGIIEEINEAISMVKIRYKSGLVHCVHYGEDYVSNSGGGFYTTQKIIINGYSQGDPVKRGDVILYNPNFFTKDPYSTQVNWNVGVLANIAFLESDGTMEDGSTICRSLSDKLEINPVHIRTMTLTKSTTVHQIAAPGTDVLSTDVLITFDESEIPEGMQDKADKELIAMLGKLNRATPKAKFTGRVVRIDAYYKCDIADMSASMQSVVKMANKLKKARADFAKGSGTSPSYMPPTKIVGSDRLGNEILDDDSVVLKFYIQQDIGMNAGDKIVFDSSLKSVCAKVLDNNIKTYDGQTEAEGMMSYRSIQARIILSPLLTGAATTVLEKLEKDILDMYFD